MTTLDDTQSLSGERTASWLGKPGSTTRSEPAGRQEMRAYSLKYVKTGFSVPLPLGKRILIGRSQECALRIRNKSVSRRHCEISVYEHQVVVRDLGSRTGTAINEKPIEGAHVLQNGDELCIGPAVLLFVVQTQAARSGGETVAQDTASSSRDTPVADIDSGAETNDENDAFFISLLRELKALRDAGSSGDLPHSVIAETGIEDISPNGDAGSGDAGSGDASKVTAKSAPQTSKTSESSPKTSSANSARDALERHFRRRL